MDSAMTTTLASRAKPTDLTDSSSPKKTTNILSRYLSGKDQQWKAYYERNGPLTLLDLPIDILHLIVKEITHTNDLTSLALANSTLYNLAIPLIYSRFDIVWPDGNIQPSETKSVDALTYGLATLCRGSSFSRTTRKGWNSSVRPPGKFMDNGYAKYTKKFSLGNGPKDWVEDYMITKEGGKMLGTLVSIAISKMNNLEAFVWDMPTGVLSDIFEALSSLDESMDDSTETACKLNRVWVRWHDNSDQQLAASSGLLNPGGSPAAVVPLGSQLTPIGIMLPADARHPTPRGPISYSEHHCEYPTFSVLPPLKSLTVLDIDELSYLDEMAVLIERSKDTLQELRVGISTKAVHKDFVQTWDGPELEQIDHDAQWPGQSTIGERRLGGVLGVLVGKVYDIRKKPLMRMNGKLAAETAGRLEPTSWTVPPVSSDTQGEVDDVTRATTPPEAQDTNGHVTEAAATQPQMPGDILAKAQALLKGEKPNKASPGGRRKRLEGKLKLQTLELERMPLSMQVCRSAFDWSTLTSLTLLECAQHETLWKILRKSFQPTPIGTGFGVSDDNSKMLPSGVLYEYHLALKHIHTDITTPALISFIKETLAPNTLEVLFLQDRRRGASGPPPVLLDTIFRGALKKHRTSLQKLLLDSSARSPLPGAVSVESTRWRNWTLNTEVLMYMTSGRMGNLRELAVSLDYKDWHTFLQRLPNIPHLRSINIPHVADYVGGAFDPRELAHQITDIITLRPEIRLCYIGLGAKCFEILESRSSPGSRSKRNGYGGSEDGDEDDGVAAAAALQAGIDSAVVNAGGLVPVDDPLEGEEEDTSDEEEVDDELDEEEETDDEITPTTANSDLDDTQSVGEEEEEDDDDDDDFDESDGGKVKLKLREILFYDDKVAVFRARHGRL
ncbi:hypothetical protein B0H66DRAFT_544983 [Apodospora peruviana]|uniref:F-box domain-containing protein n=1 Tax=Apodospora peruviana TaxID=516989 RepID=A0AAE0MGG5_9PEZI|nr:hypothetical protein B0H66DRAFT_544983 [Apodospora peruviana]